MARGAQVGIGGIRNCGMWNSGTSWRVLRMAVLLCGCIVRDETRNCWEMVALYD